MVVANYYYICLQNVKFLLTNYAYVEMKNKQCLKVY